MATIRTLRLTATDTEVAGRLFQLMARVFDDGSIESLSPEYLVRLLSRPGFWAFAAFVDEELIGGLSAHTLPMTRSESSEIFIYDIAVHPDWQRLGAGRALISSLRAAAAADGIEDIFVPADNDDSHALEFYRALGGEALAVTHFTF